ALSMSRIKPRRAGRDRACVATLVAGLAGTAIGQRSCGMEEPVRDAREVDIVVVGAGAAGLAAGIALAGRGWSVAVLGAGTARRDGRTVALMDGSVRFLAEIGCW